MSSFASASSSWTCPGSPTHAPAISWTNLRKPAAVFSPLYSMGDSAAPFLNSR